MKWEYIVMEEASGWGIETTLEFMQNALKGFTLTGAIEIATMRRLSLDGRSCVLTNNPERWIKWVNE